ncbi:MAG: AtpZ/AtpI family protein [Thermodesulfobacteriota bacterium]
MFDYKQNRGWAEHLHVVMQIGLTMAGCIVFCLFVGLYLDRWLGTRGVFTTLFIILGIIGGGVVVYRQIMEVTEPEPPEDKSEHHGNGTG